MFIIFSLVEFGTAFELVSPDVDTVGLSLLELICRQQGIPISNTVSEYEMYHSDDHRMIYEFVYNIVIEHIANLATPRFAFLSSLGNLQYRLDID